MQKAIALRAFLKAALPRFLAHDPDRLDVVIPEGTAQSTLTAAIGWTWTYTAEVVLIDFTGHPNDVLAPIILWCRRFEPDLLRPGATGIVFDADILDETKVDLRVRVKLTEGVNILPAPPPEPWPGPGPEPAPDPNALPWVTASHPLTPAPLVDPAAWEQEIEPLLHLVMANGQLAAHCDAHPEVTD